MINCPHKSQQTDVTFTKVQSLCVALSKKSINIGISYWVTLAHELTWQLINTKLIWIYMPPMPSYIHLEEV